MRQVKKLPSGHLGAITEIRILRKRVVLPAARAFDRRAAPDTGGSVKIEKPAGQMTAAVLDDEMSVQNDRLYLRQQ